MMGRIVLLDDETVNRIAAGEAVQRPASVVKELIENSIDAGARRIEVEISGAGKRTIRVHDDGAGMDREDLLLCIERHATSKCYARHEVIGSRTLGFRGEALASICAVSRLRIVTWNGEDEHGWCLEAAGGVIKDVRPASCARGTLVEVESLFFNSPVRRKFLRSDPVEAAHVREIVAGYALCRPDLSFSLLRDGRRVLSTRGGAAQLEVAGLLWRGGNFVEVGPVEAGDVPYRLHLVVSLGAPVRSSSRELFFVVNGRVVKAHSLARTVREALSDRLGEGRWPVGVIYVEADPRVVDVNVHPSKLEVRFNYHDRLSSFLYRLLRRDVRRGDAPVAFDSAARRVELGAQEEGPTHREPSLFGTAAVARSAFLSPHSSKPERPADDAAAAAGRAAGGEASHDGAGTLGNRAWALGRLSLQEAHPLGQVLGCYLLFAVPEGLLIMDQHAAHERILFERLLSSWKRREDACQSYLMPVETQLGPQEYEILQERAEELGRLGFRFRLDGDVVVLDGGPLDVPPAAASALLEAYVSAALEEGSVEAPMERRLRAMAARAACRTAVKGGDPLSPGQMMELLEGVLGVERKLLSCPHGRPSILVLDSSAFERAFGRDGGT